MSACLYAKPSSNPIQQLLARFTTGVRVPCLMAALLGLGFWMGTRHSNSNSAIKPEHLSTTPAVLDLQGTRVEQRAGYLTISGQVRNAATGSEEHVEAVCELLDSRGSTVHVECALVNAVSIHPGEETTFSIQCPDPGGVAGYRVRFRALFGRDLPIHVAAP